MCTQKMRALSYIGAEKITFPSKPYIQTDIHTYRRTDISVYRVASLLKSNKEREIEHDIILEREKKIQRDYVIIRERKRERERVR